jgi:multicomponent Na+:H+ antiporter subunit G
VSLLGDVLSWICILVGGAFLIIGGVGMLRFPDFYTRIHAASLTDSMGAGFILLGLMFQGGLALVTVKVFLVLLFLLFTGPVAVHALCQSARHGGLDPVVADDGEG